MFKTHISTTIPLDLATRLQNIQSSEGWKNVSALMRHLVEKYVEEFEAIDEEDSSEEVDISDIFKPED